MLVNAFWFGYTLFYYTKNHLFYSTVNGKSNCLFSFDNYSYKNQILGMMNDRVVFGSKPNILNSKQAKQPKYKMEVSQSFRLYSHSFFHLDSIPPINAD